MKELQVQFFNGRENKADTVDLEIIEGSITNEFMSQRHAFVEVLRREWEVISDSIDKLNDKVLVVDNGNVDIAGRFVNISKTSKLVEIEIGSMEEDLRDVEPVNGAVQKIGSDDAVIESIIDADGTGAFPPVNFSSAVVDQVTDGPVSFLFTNNTTAGAIRMVQETTGAFIRYDGVNRKLYYEAFPEGQTPVTTISPDQQNILDSFEITEDSRDEYTHIRVLGAGEGDSQISVETQLPSYSGTGRERWGVFTDTDITTVERANEVLDTLVDEIENAPRHLKAKTVVFGEDINLGTPVRVKSDKDGVDESPMYAVKVTKKFDGDSEVSEVKFSNRLLSEKKKGDDVKNKIQNLTEGVQGDIVSITSGNGRKSVDSDNSYTITVRSPADTVEILTSRMRIESLAYTADTDDPAINRFSGETPSNVSLWVNGEEIDSSVGTGLFTIELDLDDYVDPGEDNIFVAGLNTITVKSDSLGDIRATVFIDAYRQVT